MHDNDFSPDQLARKHGSRLSPVFLDLDGKFGRSPTNIAASP